MEQDVWAESWERDYRLMGEFRIWHMVRKAELAQNVSGRASQGCLRRGS
jgi:hypothetical protein